MRDLTAGIARALEELGIKAPNEGYDVEDLAADLVLELSERGIVVLDKPTYDSLVIDRRAHG